MLVKPHEILPLWPMITPGTPEKVTPATSNGHAVLTVLQCRPIWYQMEGIRGPRCGSLASSGLPVADREPAMTQELEPIPLPFGPSSGGILSSRSARSSSSSRARRGSARGGAACWSYSPLTTAPCFTIGWWRVYG
jgi:hypothetical protein